MPDADLPDAPAPETDPARPDADAAGASPGVYDEAPYFSTAFPQTHIAALAAAARLFGVDAPDPARARVLEIGCASGGNLLPMAEEFPEAEFVGLDLSARQIGMARAAARAAGLANATFLDRDLAAYPKQDRPFDYIIAHGVFSWLPPAVADALLGLAGENLSARGVAYVSYNALPGWHLKKPLRDLLLFAARDAHTPDEKLVAAARVMQLYQQWADANRPGSVPAKLLADEIAVLRTLDQSYLLHEQFEPENNPVYFEEFMRRAGAHGLDYLAEADLFATVLPAAQPRRDRFFEALGGGERRRAEQYRDFFAMRQFRQTLLVRGGAAPAAAVDPEAARGLYYLPRYTPGDGDRPDPDARVYLVGNDRTEITVRRSPAMAAVLDAGAAARPRALSFDELFAAADARLAEAGRPPVDGGQRTKIAVDLVTQGLMAVRAARPPATNRPGERPRAGAVARHLATRANSVPTGLHGQAVLIEPLRLLVTLLDGTRTRRALVGELALKAVSGELHLARKDGDAALADPAEIERAMTSLLPRLLDELQRLGLLVGAPGDA